MTEDEHDKEYEALVSPMPTVIAKSLAKDSDYTKCPRCWHYHSVLLNFDGLCDAYCRSIPEGWPEHWSVPFIKACKDAQKSILVGAKFILRVW